MNKKFKVAFVDFANNFFDRHPVYCLSAYLKKNDIDTHYINETSFSKIISRLKTLKPDLLLYSAYSRDMQQYINFDQVLKKQLGTKSVIGGAGPTFEYKIFRNSTIDGVCLGEGEYAILDFIKNGFSPVKNIISSQDGKSGEFYPLIDVNTMSFSDRELVYKNDYVLRNMSAKQFLAGRGCPYMCTYCHNGIFNKMFQQCGPIVRQKTVKYLLEEIKEVQSRYPLKAVIFQDDTFILRKSWLFEFCEHFPREIGLPYTCNIRADLVDEEVVKALKKSNCACAYWSIESGDDFIRNKLLKRRMSREQILQTAHLLNKYKVPHRNGGMVGLPGESIAQMFETLELNIETKPKFGFTSVFIPFAGLELTEYALKHKHLSESASKNLPKNTHLHSVLNFSQEENLLIQKLTYLYPIFVNYPKFYDNRRIRSLLFKLPKFLLYIIFNLFSAYKLSVLYKVQTPLFLKLRIVWRYVKNPF